jgi:predicted transposase YdaD
MADFDIISKQLFKDYAQDFLRFVLGSKKAFEILKVTDSGLRTVEARETDILVLVKIDDEESLVHIEFQTSDSTKTPMPRRMAGYIGRLIEEYGVPIYSFVIYLRPDAGSNDPGQYFQDRPGSRILIEYGVVRLISLEGQRIIDEKLWGLLPFALLMQPPKDTPLEEWFRECIRAVDELGLAQSDKADFLVYLLTLGGLVYDSQTLFNIISEETLYESSIAQHFAERGRRKGIEQGIERGIEQGIQQGLMLAVLDVISERFSPNRAEQLKPTLESIQEIARLREILVKASEVETFDKLQQAVDTLIS